MNTKKSIEKSTKKESKFKKAVTKFYKKFFKNMSFSKQIFFWYIFITFFFSFFLWSSITHKQSAGELKYIDALFTSASAFSDTGLTVVNTFQQFNTFGQVLIFLQFILGGIGWFTIKLFLISFFLKKFVRRKHIVSHNEESGTLYSNQAIGISKVATIVTIGSIFLFGIIMGIMFATINPSNPELLSSNPEANLVGNWGQAMWTGFFTAGSSINNAGFDILAGNSFSAYFGNIEFQVIVIFLFVLGGIGFGIIYDLKEYIKTKRKGQRFRFSLMTKISVISYIVVALFGLIFVYMFEVIAFFKDRNNSFLGMEYVNGTEDLSMFDRVWAIFFNTMSTRNAGFATVNFNSFSTGSTIIYSIMMFIGSGPGSTAGGIRTTTFFVIVMSIVNYLKGTRRTNIFKRHISETRIKESMIISFSSIILVFLGVLILTASETGRNTQIVNNNDILPPLIPPPDTERVPISFVQTIFLVISAFGTTGLSTADLSGLHVVSKLTLIAIMFIGQLGISTTLKQFNTRSTKNIKREYINEDISYG